MQPSSYSIGLDFGTNSVRALIVDVTNGNEIAEKVVDYPSGTSGVVLDENDPHLARQKPSDYISSMRAAVKGALEIAAKTDGFTVDLVVAMGVDTTGSTPIPVDAEGVALELKSEFANNVHAYAWLWKDHTSSAEAIEITEKAQNARPDYVAKYGGVYSSEWYWAKLLRCSRVAPDVFAAAYTWVELADWVPAVLTGTTHPSVLKRGICASGHKAFFSKSWGGYPDAEFLGLISPDMPRIGESLPKELYTVGQAAGHLSEEWASDLGLKAGIPVSIGAFDCHLGAVGSGITPGVLVKTMGTSTCDIAIQPLSKPLADIPGVCGTVPESVLPGFYGIEAGQSAVGDLFNWFVNVIQPGGDKGTHEQLTSDAAKLKPGQSGLVALDWHNGNRTILVDQQLTGLMVGMTLQTRPAEIYRALVEATAFGARIIVEQMARNGVQIDRVVICGGISAKNAMAMQIYADVLNRTLEVSRSTQACALGSAIAGSVAAGKHPGFAEAMEAMAGVQEHKFVPIKENAVVYERLFKIYESLHDSFGIVDNAANLYPVMKDLLAIRKSVCVQD